MEAADASGPPRFCFHAKQKWCLLPQPGGFEGFAWVIPGPEMSHLAVLNPHGVRPEELDRLSRTGAKHLDPNLGKDQVSGVDHLSGARALDMHEVDVFDESPGYRIAAPKDPGVRPDGILLVHDIGRHVPVGELVELIGIPLRAEPLDPSVQPTPHDLHVLLRHRLRSISRARGRTETSAFACGLKGSMHHPGPVKGVIALKR